MWGLWCKLTTITGACAVLVVALILLLLVLVVLAILENQLEYALVDVSVAYAVLQQSVGQRGRYNVRQKPLTDCWLYCCCCCWLYWENN